jgi:hypothetical protein
MDFFGASASDSQWPASSAVVREVLDEWMALAWCADPWRQMYRDDLVGGLRPVVVALVAEAPGGGDGRRGRLRAAAVAHGLFRRHQRCSPLDLTEELSMLAAAIVEVFLRHGVQLAAADMSDALVRDLRCVGRAVHAGYLDEPSSQRGDGHRHRR